MARGIVASSKGMGSMPIKIVAGMVPGFSRPGNGGRPGKSALYWYIMAIKHPHATMPTSEAKGVCSVRTWTRGPGYQNYWERFSVSPEQEDNFPIETSI